MTGTTENHIANLTARGDEDDSPNPESFRKKMKKHIKNQVYLYSSSTMTQNDSSN